MGSVVAYGFIQKSMFSHQQTNEEALGYWDNRLWQMGNSTVLNVQLASDVEVTIDKTNIKKHYLKTGTIYKLLYL